MFWKLNAKNRSVCMVYCKLCKIIFFAHEIVAVNLPKTYFLKNAKKTNKPNNSDLNRDSLSENP